jgi:hypothetical protein
MNKIVEEFAKQYGEKITDDVEMFAGVVDIDNPKSNYYNIDNKYLLIEEKDGVELYDKDGYCVEGYEWYELEKYMIEEKIKTYDFPYYNYPTVWNLYEQLAETYLCSYKFINMDLNEWLDKVAELSEEEMKAFLTSEEPEKYVA